MEARGTCRQDLPLVDLDLDMYARLEAGQLARIIAVRKDMCQ